MRPYLAFGILGIWLAAQAEAPKSDPVKFFETEVQPILQAHCIRCHGGEAKIKGGLKLTSRDHILKGGDSGPAVVLNKPEASLILDAIHHKDTLKMPPKGKLPQAQVDILTRWVTMGLPYPADSTATKTVKHGPPPVDDQARQFWAFRPVKKPEVPTVKNSGWVKNPIDAFVLARLEKAGFAPAPPADPQTWIRRVTFDLIGLPPTSQEVDDFLQESAIRNPQSAMERVVDRLLESRHYGEHWARKWLDLVRYAETNSFERDGAKPFMWRYRDYVIRAFNEDRPYDQFIREQLAGDELDTVTADTIIATGYYRLGQWDDEPVDRVQAVYDELDDILSTTSQAFLGLTVGCARCHDHKIDPMPQKDYYRLLAFFHGVKRYGPGELRHVGTAEERKKHHDVIAVHKQRLADLDKDLKAIEDLIAPRLGGGEGDDFKHEANKASILKKHVGKLVSKEEFELHASLRKQRGELAKAPPPGGAQALAVTENKAVPDTHVFTRGNPQAKADKVQPGFPLVLTTKEPALPKPAAESAGRRRVLADWVASPDNPMTARVMVNRLWQHHFGRGIVRSSSNFGYQGTPPTHPELLDWLASEFTSGWSIKKMHRLMVLSSTYRMSGQANPAALAKDPENDLFWRFNMRRLSAEEVRDAILAVCGNLNLKKTDGPSIYPVIPREVLAGQSIPGNGWGKSTPEEAASRSVYVHIKRSLTVPILGAFDSADPDAPCPVRFTTTQPAQALGLLNSDFVNEQAKVFADSVRKQAGTSPADQVRLVLKRACQRDPKQAEIDRGVRFIQVMMATDRLAAEEALRRFCLLALNLNEFVYLD